MKKYKIPNKTIVARFIAWYLLVMIVVVMVESISTFKTLNALESNSVHIVENSIKNGISSIDKQLQQMENVAFSITQNVSLSSFFKASQQSEFSNSELTNFKKIVSSYQGGNLSGRNDNERTENGNYIYSVGEYSVFYLCLCKIMMPCLKTLQMAWLS